MDTKKMILPLMIVLSLGIVALPATMSLFAGQHCWYDLGAEGNQVPCVKCHADIADELDAGGHHDTLYEGGMNKACEACHRENSSITYASGTGDSAIPGKEAHAASTIYCGYCHFNSSNPTGAPVAGGFGQSDDLLNDTGKNASHYSFVVQSRDPNILQNESESCVACHTTTSVTINFNVTTGMTIEVNNTIISDSSAYWNMTSVAPSDYTTYTEEK